jgi:hypothetical protein
MTKILLKAGAEIDVPTRAEVREDIHDAWRSYESEREQVRARGVKWIRVAANDPLTPTKETIYGPEPGYIWKLSRFSTTLTGADSVSLYIGDAVSNRLIGFTPAVTGQSVYVIGFTGPSELLLGGETLYAVTSGSYRFTNYYLSAWQVPEEMQWKLL